jgi:predicted enzyme related to lactoylglutathione lyase
LDFPVQSIDDSRRKALSLGGDIDDVPPNWAVGRTDFFFGYDPEGNQFGVRLNVLGAG